MQQTYVKKNANIKIKVRQGIKTVTVDKKLTGGVKYCEINIYKVQPDLKSNEYSSIQKPYNFK